MEYDPHRIDEIDPHVTTMHPPSTLDNLAALEMQRLPNEEVASFAMTYSSGSPLYNVSSNTSSPPPANPALVRPSLPSPPAPHTNDQEAVKAAFQGSEVGRFVLAAYPGIADEGIDTPTLKRHLEEMLGLEPKNGLGRNYRFRSAAPAMKVTRQSCENLRAVLVQVTGDARGLSGACSRCARGNGQWEQCVTASPSLSRDPLKGACANCFFRNMGAKCSLRDPPKPRQSSAAAAAAAAARREDKEEEENSDDDDSGLRMFEASVKLLSSVAAVQAVPHRMLLPCSRIVNRTTITGTTTAKKGSCQGCASRMERTKADAQALQRDLEGLTHKLQEVCELAHEFSTALAKTLPSRSGFGG